jgi:hypothetical protein
LIFKYLMSVMNHNSIVILSKFLRNFIIFFYLLYFYNYNFILILQNLYAIHTFYIIIIIIYFFTRLRLIHFEINSMFYQAPSLYFIN